ncbi:cilia- and flagella-associated protein 65 isoform X1 [Lethenteron reissneri]|uniref:cilia- and flagella-associated protein 65 isoform X1 n=2 Tax=Lethenteron reissneri TaxID=7753 RepID=UPI002AB6D2E6|nr:cilia- and flagella-associated protein 65 isoform X1 [Lethenteron reissneri]
MMLAHCQPCPTPAPSMHPHQLNEKHPKAHTSVANVGKAGRKAQNHGQRVLACGIETVAEVLWTGWQPGRENTKKLSLKNVLPRAVKLTYRVPSSLVFSTLYPQPIILNSGTSYTLPIIFRPLEKREYEERLEFESVEGRFCVVLRATLPTHKLHLPGTLTFGHCATFHNQEVHFDMHNRSELETSFGWEVPPPFSMNPAQGVLSPNASLRITASVHATEAGPYYAMATCHYGEAPSSSSVVELQAIAKYPRLVVSAGDTDPQHRQYDSQQVLNFGDVEAGATSEKWLHIQNLSSVKASFQVEITTPNPQTRNLFGCRIQQGWVNPQGSARVPVRFSPVTVGCCTTQYLHVVMAGNLPKCIVKLTGNCQGPSVTMSETLLVFDRMLVGEVGVRTLELRNSSAVPAIYQFALDTESSVFGLERVCGQLPPHATVQLRVTFTPQQPINYYRRVACLVHHQAPVHVELLGAGSTVETTPAVLRREHVQRCHTNARRGLTLQSPPTLLSMLHNKKLCLDPTDGSLIPCQEEVEKQDPTTVAPSNAVFDHRVDGRFELCWDEALPPTHVSLSASMLDFSAFVRDGEKAAALALSLRNHTHGTVCVVWTASAGGEFHVEPAECEVPPLKTIALRVTFRPRRRNTLHYAELEACAFYKSMKDFRLVEEPTMCLPWCLTLAVSTHTFQPGQQPFPPTCNLSSAHVEFPAVTAGKSTHTTALLTNTGDTPIFFSLPVGACPASGKPNPGTSTLGQPSLAQGKGESRAQERLQGAIGSKEPEGVGLVVRPSQGLVPPGGKQVVLLRASSSAPGLYCQVLPILLNYCGQYTKNMEVSWLVDRPQVRLQGNGRLFFKPTCIGTMSQCSHTIDNCCQLPLCFQWNVTGSGTLSVSPAHGIIQPNESVSQVWSFSPLEDKKYVLKPSLLVWLASSQHWGQLDPVQSHQQGDKEETSSSKTRLSLRVIGEGAIGNIRAMESDVNLGVVVVGTAALGHLTLVNDSNCDLSFTLSVEQHELQACGPDKVMMTQTTALELNEYESIIPARCSKQVQAMARPTCSGRYHWTVSYQLVTQHAGLALGVRELCRVTAEGARPILSVLNVRGSGSAAGLSKMQLWTMMNLWQLNFYLDLEPPYEDAPDSGRPRVVLPCRTPPPLQFDLGSASAGAEPSVIHLLLQNPGLVEAHWAVVFPNENSLELEVWAEHMDLDARELRIARLQRDQTFTVFPRGGQLQPGAKQIVTVTYRHEFPASDWLMVVFRVTHGRSIPLNLVGVTVPSDLHYIHYPSHQHTLLPVALRCQTPPIQVFDLYNGGAMPVSFLVQQDSLRVVCDESYSHSVLECLTPEGNIAPGETAHTLWLFCPLEAKTYTVDVPIHVLHGESSLVTFRGVGFDEEQTDNTHLNWVNSLTQLLPSAAPFPHLPLQLSHLSVEQLSFGELPVYSKSTRILFLSNTSKDRAVFFIWRHPSHVDTEVLNLEPKEGTLHPGGSVLCKLTLRALGQPILYDLDLVCEVIDMMEFQAFTSQQAKMDAEYKRQEVEFTITEHDLLPPAAPTSTASQAPEKLANHQSPVLSGSSKHLNKYKALPPIGAEENGENSGTRSQRRQRRSYRKEREEITQPELPRPQLLHLGVSIRTHSIQSFEAQFSQLMPAVHISRISDSGGCLRHPAAKDEGCHMKDGAKCHINDDMRAFSPLTDEQRELLPLVLSNLLKSLMDDKSFHQALAHLEKEPVSFYRQFSIRDETQQRIAQEHTDVSSEENISGMDATEICPSSANPELTASAPVNGNNWNKYEMESNVFVSREKITLQQPYEKEVLWKDQLKRLPELRNLLELVLENTLANIVTEASNGEVILTSRPRFIALPPPPPSALPSLSQHMILASTERHTQTPRSGKGASISSKELQSISPAGSKLTQHSLNTAD